MNNDNHTNISLTEAAWLAGRLGLKFGPLSPLKKATDTAGTDADRTSLANKGLLDDAGNIAPDAASCMLTITNPGGELVIDVGNASVLDFMKVYFGRPESASACTPVDGSHFRISPVIDLEDILLTLLEGLDISPDMHENPFSCDLSSMALIALSALIDATRQNQLRSLLNRNDNVELAVDFVDVWACLQRGIVEDSFHWLTTVIRSRLPDEMSIEQKTLSEGLQELVAAGLAVRDEYTWAIAEDRVEFLTELMTPLSFGSVFARAFSGNETVRLLLVRCPTSLWAVNFSANGGKVSLFTLSAERLGMIVTEAVARLMVIGRNVPASTPSSTAPPSVPQEPANQAAVKKFCTECGTPLKPDARFCAACGHKI